MKTLLVLFSLYLLSWSMVAQSDQVIHDAKEYKKTKLYVSLPTYCPTPDNMDITPDGSLVVSCPNYADKKEKGTIIKITKDKKISPLVYLQNIASNLYAIPKGIAYAPDGSLFVCNDVRGDGQIMRLTFRENTLQKTEIIAKGLSPNGIKYHNGYLYVTQTRKQKVNEGEAVEGLLYRFSVEDRNIPDFELAKHLIFSTTNTSPIHPFGLDGLTFDKDGNLYVGEFGDATIHKLTLDKNGAVVKKEIYAQLPENTGVDGMVMDEKYNLYVVGFCQNQLIRVTAEKKIEVIVQYGDNNGANGELDQPVDVIFYDNKLLISNFDLMSTPSMVNKSHGKPYTISYIDVKDL